MQASVEFRRSGDLILKARRLPILPFLAPSIPPSWIGRSQRHNHNGRRKIHTHLKASSPARGAARGTLQRSTPYLKTPPLDPKNGPELNARITADYEALNKHANSAELLKEAWAKESIQDDPAGSQSNLNFLENEINKKITGAGKSTATLRKFDPLPSRSLGGQISGKMQFPISGDGMSQQQASRAIAMSINATQAPSTRTVRSRPTVGRTIDLNPDRGIDFGRGLNLLQGRIARDKIPQFLAKQRFHERAGLKRKRLKSERWRKYFKQGFDAMVTRVKQMKAQGW